MTAEGTVTLMSILQHVRYMKGRAGTRRGFTLLELLAVMAIMAMLTTLAVVSYFSAIRGMARRSASEHFLNSLVQARQRACIDGTRVSLMLFNQPLDYDDQGQPTKVLPSYVVCREFGRITFIKGAYLFDEFSDLKQLFGDETSGNDVYSGSYTGGFRLYNLSKGCWGMVESRVKREDYGSSQTLFATLSSDYDSHMFEDYAFKQIDLAWAKSDNPAQWNVGDSYGIEVSPILNLPKTFYFNELGWDGQSPPAASSLTKIQYVTFGPDGRSMDEGNNTRTVTFRIKSSDPQMRDITYTVQTDGKITD